MQDGRPIGHVNIDVLTCVQGWQRAQLHKGRWRLSTSWKGPRRSRWYVGHRGRFPQELWSPRYNCSYISLVPLGQIKLTPCRFSPPMFTHSFPMNAPLYSINCPSRKSGLKEFLSKSFPLLTPKSSPTSRTWDPHMFFPAVRQVSACVWVRWRLDLWSPIMEILSLMLPLLRSWCESLKRYVLLFLVCWTSIDENFFFSYALFFLTLAVAWN